MDQELCDHHHDADLTHPTTDKDMHNHRPYTSSRYPKTYKPHGTLGLADDFWVPLGRKRMLLELP